MIGKVLKIDRNKTGRKYGVISGNDGQSYYYSILSQKVEEIQINDQVEFEVVIQPDKKMNSVKNLRILCNADKDNGPIVFYTKGYYKDIDKDRTKKEHLKNGSGEYEVLEKLSKLLYISHINHYDMGKNVIFPYCLIGATTALQRFIRGQYEFLLVFSHFDKGDWQQNTLKVVYEIRHRKEIIERKPLVNFYILVSNAKTLKQEIDKMKGGTSEAIIPFTFDEILKCDGKTELKELIISRFEEYIFENNMLGEEHPIEEETLLFGDRGKIADSIVYRASENKNSGIFGLRRSGKSSVLRAVERRLVQNGIKYTVVQARSELETIDSWKSALYDIARKIRISVTGIKQNDGESRKQYDERLHLSSSEEDYQKRPTQSFVEDVKLYTKEESAFVVAIDEIELITYNTASSNVWQDLDAYKGFWGALRDSGVALIICGVNSTINEISSISYKGKKCDNPMYERIHNCAEFSKTYLPAFTDEQTKIMINTLGSYSNLGFDNVYVDINRAFGGQPYAIRQFCAYVFEKVKEHRKPSETYQVSKPTFVALSEEFNNSIKGMQLFDTILQHIQIYSNEYEMLKELALMPEKHRKFTQNDAILIDHLEKYGIIEFDKTTGFVTFNILSLKEYICKNAKKKPEYMSNDERIQYALKCIKNCEEKLKKYILNILTYNKTFDARTKLLQWVTNSYIKVNSKATPKPDIKKCSIKDFFNHKLFIMYFSTLKKIILDMWSICECDFIDNGITKASFDSGMDDLNAGRTDSSHFDPYEPDNSDNWIIDDITLQAFITANNRFEMFFKALGL